jgi:hypothetical protein
MLFVLYCTWAGDVCCLEDEAGFRVEGEVSVQLALTYIGHHFAPVALEYLYVVDYQLCSGVVVWG